MLKREEPAQSWRASASGIARRHAAIAREQQTKSSCRSTQARLFFDLVRTPIYQCTDRDKLNCERNISKNSVSSRACNANSGLISVRDEAAFFAGAVTRALTQTWHFQPTRLTTSANNLSDYGRQQSCDALDQCRSRPATTGDPLRDNAQEVTSQNAFARVIQRRHHLAQNGRTGE